MNPHAPGIGEPEKKRDIARRMKTDQALLKNRARIAQELLKNCSRMNCPIQNSMFQISKMKMCKPGRDNKPDGLQIQDMSSKVSQPSPVT
jgi:hypothetical protein